MNLDGWISIGITLATVAALIFTRYAPDVILVGAMTCLLALDVLTPDAALSGLANPGLATVGVLYIVASGLTETGAVHALGQRLLGRPASVIRAQVRLMLPIMGLSAFLNNTPLVAMFIPVVQDWARKCRMPVSKLMLPLSYAAILGGTCTIIGTSTNLVVAGLVLSSTDLEPVGFFEIAWLGLPTALAGLVMILATSRWLLPARNAAILEPSDLREYAVEVMVAAGSPIAGQTIEAAGLRHLPGLFLAEIQRNDTVLPAISPLERLCDGDRLVFVGNVDSVVDLYKIRGLVPAPDQVFKLDAPRPERLLVEAVLSPVSPVVHQTIRDCRFRSRYDAVVIAAARGGRRLTGRIGDIKLEAGDTLLLEARPSFVEQHRRSRDFLLVSPVRGSRPPRHDRAPVAIVILLSMVAAATAGVPMLTAGLVAGGAMLVLRCTTGALARRSVDWQVLTVIAAAFAIGTAIESSGAAQQIANAWTTAAGDSPWLALAAIYILTMLMTEVITNNGAAALMFPIAEATAASLDVSFRPFVMAIMMAASASFATPIGYQTNMMVYGPGGYVFTDYLRFGLPLNLTCAVIAITLTPLIWPF